MRILRGISRIAIAVVLAIVVIAGFLFGSQFQENAHLAYLRSTMRDVVKITNSKGSGGTGFLTTTPSGRKVIITNGHVCGLAENGMVFVHFRGDILILKMIAVYSRHDLCAIEAPLYAGKGYRVAKSVVEGESVYTLGHPYLEPNTITKGELSGDVIVTIPKGFNVEPSECKGEGYTLLDVEQFNPMLGLFGVRNVCIRSMLAQGSSINILPGNSGSPDVNIYGNVVSVTFAANESGTRSYHVPLAFLKDFLGAL